MHLQCFSDIATSVLYVNHTHPKPICCRLVDERGQQNQPHLLLVSFAFGSLYMDGYICYDDKNILYSQPSPVSGGVDYPPDQE